MKNQTHQVDLKSLKARLLAEELATEQWRQDVRAGRLPAPSWGEGGTWSVSDRH